MVRTNMEQGGNGWNEYQKLVLASLADLKEEAKGNREQIAAMRTELAVIKQRATLWGAVSGCVGAVMTIGGAYIKSKVAP
jgi:hypothetical protein